MAAAPAAGMDRGTFAELATFMDRQQLLMKEQQELLLEQQRETEARMKAALEEQRQLMAPQEAISDQQIEALTARLQAAHAAKLLSDSELFSAEDCVADFLEVKASVGVVTLEILNAYPVAGKMQKLVVLSGGIADDAMWSRQVRRKFT